MRPLVAAGLGVTVLTPLYVYYKHGSLSKIVKKTYSFTGTVNPKLGDIGYVDTSPGALIFADRFERAVALPDHLRTSTADLVTPFVREGMARFSGMTQGRLIRFANRASKDPMTPEEIRKLNFEVGDTLLGTYEVTSKDPGVVALTMRGVNPPVDGAMVFRVEPTADGATFSTETKFFNPADGSNAKCPMANPVFRIWHELTAMKLIKKFTDDVSVP